MSGVISLLRAYELVGYTPDRDYSYIEINRQLRQTYAGIVEDAIRQIRELGGEVHREVGSDLLFVNGEIKVSVIKDNAGMGAFYRSKHEIICVYKNGTAKHTNNFGLGENGRYRTNVWDYPGVNSLKGTGHRRGRSSHIRISVVRC